MDKIIIEDSYITKKNNITRLNTVVIEDGKKNILWADVENEFAQYLCPELIDSIIYLCLPICLREGKSLSSKLPASEILLHNINEYLIPHLVRGDSRLSNFEIEAPYSGVKFNGTGVGTALTGGVDSTYSILEYHNCKYQELSLTHLVVTSESVDLWDSANNDFDLIKWEEKHSRQFLRYKEMSSYLGLPLIKICTNYYSFLCKKDMQDRIKNYFVHVYQTMAAVLAIKKLWKAYIFSSSNPFNSFNLLNNSTKDNAHYDLLTGYTLTTPDFLWINGGAKSDRIEKTLALSDYPFAQKFLHPCFSHEDKNCSNPSCGKCLRALLTLDYYDKLDSIRNIFDVDKYLKKKHDYLIQLIRLKNDLYLKPLYDMFIKKYPNDMALAQDDYNRNISPVSRKIYNWVNDAYTLSLKYLVLKNIDYLLKTYFQSNGISTIYVIGSSRLWLTLKQPIEKIISVLPIEHMSNNKNNYILITETECSNIENLQKEYSEKGFTNILTLESLLKHLKAID